MSDPYNPYAELYAHPKGVGDQRPTALQVAKDNDRINKLGDKVALVTGGTSGIGIETARALHATGAYVYITARNLEKAKAVIEDIVKTNGGKDRLDVIEMDMESLESAKKAAKAFLSKSDKLSILVNNAGIMACPESRSADGYELQFAVNHLAHFAFTSILMPTLIASSTPTFNSRVVNVSSSSHRYSTIHIDNINLVSEYEPHKAYGQSKIANIWMVNHLERLYGSRGVHALSLNPGGIWTGLTKYIDEKSMEAFRKDEGITSLMQSAEQGSVTTMWAAVGKIWEGKGGKYLADCKVAGPADRLDDVINSGYAPWAYDEKGEKKLWELSCEMAKVSWP